MKVRILSDTHINDYGGNYSRVIAKIECKFRNICKDEILVLPGDIGTVTTSEGIIDPDFEAFMKYLKTKWRYIVLVPGNTEYHGIENFESLIVTEKLLEDKCKEWGITYLQKQVARFDDYYFVGCTLWKYVTNKDWKELPKEDREIFMDKGIYKMSYMDNLEWLNETLTELGKNPNAKVIVVTHYPPVTTARYPRFKWLDESGSSHFSNHIEHFCWEHRHTIKGWICGHIHDKDMLTVGKVPVYLNTMGEPEDSIKLNDGLINF